MTVICNVRGIKKEEWTFDALRTASNTEKSMAMQHEHMADKVAQITSQTRMK